MKGQYNRIITTDVKDVIFQTNPSIWLDENLGDKEINVACESIAYKDEEWGTNNLMKSFGPLVHEECVNNPIYNAGTISGKLDTMVDLFLNIYMLSNIILYCLVLSYTVLNHRVLSDITLYHHVLSSLPCIS